MIIDFLNDKLVRLWMCWNSQTFYILRVRLGHKDWVLLVVGYTVSSGVENISHDQAAVEV